MESDELTKTKDTSRTTILLAGSIIGALIGAGAAYLLIQKAERENQVLHVGTGEGIKLGLMALGMLRQVAQLGGGD